MSYYRPRSEGDNVLGGVRPSVRPSLCLSKSNLWRAAVDIRGSALPSATKSKESRYQSEEFVCVSTYCADAVDRLLIIGTFGKQRGCIFHVSSQTQCQCQSV